MNADTSLIIIGAGGHAKVLVDTLQLLNAHIIGISDPLQPTDGCLTRYKWYANDEAILKLSPAETILVNAIGSTKDTLKRSKLFRQFKVNGFHFQSVIHPQSFVSQTDMEIGEGLQALVGSVINAGVSLGDNVLVNTHAIVEHDCTIGSHTHIASGAIVCGGCLIGENVHVGAGAVIKQGITIGSGSVIASGAVVIEDVKPFSLVAGVPAKVKRMLPHE